MSTPIAESSHFLSLARRPAQAPPPPPPPPPPLAAGARPQVRRAATIVSAAAPAPRAHRGPTGLLRDAASRLVGHQQKVAAVATSPARRQQMQQPGVPACRASPRRLPVKQRCVCPRERDPRAPVPPPSRCRPGSHAVTARRGHDRHLRSGHAACSSQPRAPKLLAFGFGFVLKPQRRDGQHSLAACCLPQRATDDAKF